MNAILLSSKSRRKFYDSIVKEMMDFCIVSNMLIAKSAAVNQIEEINPHCVIIDKSVKMKDIDMEGFICLLRLKVQNLRIIYNFGTVEDVNDTAFRNTVAFLQQQKVYDIIINDNEVQQIIEKPMKFGDITEKIQDVIELKKKLTVKSDEHTGINEEKKENAKVELNFFALSDNYDFDINNITEIIDDGEDRKDNCLTIAICQLQHHLGCTRTSFEMAKYLYSKLKNPCVVMTDNETYRNMLSFYRYKTTAAADGFSIDNIHVLPFNSLENAQRTYTHVIIDIGYFKPEYELALRKSDIKIMMCSAAEWDLIHISRWLNYPRYDYTRDINYLFTASQQRYVQLNKSLLKGNCMAYRVDYNDHSFNKKVYEMIMKRYDLRKPNAHKKRKIMKLR